MSGSNYHKKKYLVWEIHVEENAEYYSRLQLPTVLYFISSMGNGHTLSIFQIFQEKTMSYRDIMIIVQHFLTPLFNLDTFLTSGSLILKLYRFF
jgi:hypothetical protein